MGSTVTDPFVILNGVKNLQLTKHKKKAASLNVNALMLCCGSFVTLRMTKGFYSNKSLCHSERSEESPTNEAQKKKQHR